jgi:hypothetical protein
MAAETYETGKFAARRQRKAACPKLGRPLQNQTLLLIFVEAFPSRALRGGEGSLLFLYCFRDSGILSPRLEEAAHKRYSL